MKVLAFLAAIIIIAGSCQAEEWPTFRRDSMQTGYSAEVGPESPDVAWSARMEPCPTSLSVADYTVYVGSGRYVRALNAFNGSEMWRTEMDGDVSPITFYGGEIFFGTTSGTLYSLDGKTGAVNWSTTLSGSVGAPLIAGDRLYAIAGNKILSVYASTGGKAWEKTLDGLSGLAAGTNSVVVAAETGYVWMLDQNGGTVWVVETGKSITYAPSLSDGLVYVSAGTRLIVIDNGAITENLDAGSKIGPVSVGPDAIYFGCKNGSIIAILKGTWEEKWTYKTGGDISSSPAVSENAIFVSSEDGYLYCIDLQTGGLLWKTRLGVNGSCYPSLAYRKVFVSSGDTIYCIGSWGTVPNGAFITGLVYVTLSICFLISLFVLGRIKPGEKTSRRKTGRKTRGKRRS